MASFPRFLVLALALFATPIAQALTDADILTFALNLEYLEANFYSCAAYGKPISLALSGGGSTLGCVKAALSPAALYYAKAISKDETAHVAFLRSALTAAGVTPVVQPTIDIGAAFGAAANAAFNATLKPPFSPYGSDWLFYLGAFIFEDVGVTAYHGALPLFTNPAYISPASGILGTEAYHAGAIRTLLYQIAGEYVFPYGATVNTVAGAISALRDAAAGTHIDPGLEVGTALDLVPSDANSIVYARTTTQVLDVVYLGGVNKGGFFPNGVNGAISSNSRK